LPGDPDVEDGEGVIEGGGGGDERIGENGGRNGEGEGVQEGWRGGRCIGREEGSTD
jgi:hypothetical protein